MNDTLKYTARAMSGMATSNSDIMPARDKSLVEMALDSLQSNVELTASTINDLASRLTPVLQSREGEEKVSGGPRNIASCKLEERITDIQSDVARLHSVVARLRDTLCI